MNSEIKKAVQKSAAVMQQAHAAERGNFKALLLSNPNYFGNLEQSPYKPVLPIAGNTHYEELACVGLQPQLRQLEAVVYLYQPGGYGGDICGPGTPEYVRFYLSFDKGATWQDQGMTSFQAFDIPQGTEGSKRLEFAVSLAVDPPRRFCFFDPLVRVRAILSWNDPPPAGQPGWTPVWGNVREATVLIEPRRFVPPFELLQAAKIELPPEIAQIIDAEVPIPTKQPQPGPVELAALYKDKGVPVHRYAYKELAGFLSQPSGLSVQQFSVLLPGIAVDPGVIGALFPKTDGDTSYEELRCIGLDPNFPDTLVGVVQVKKTSGYSGGPCTLGSQEFVTFWADFDGNGSFETCLGTAAVRVYDLGNVPPEGVHYAVRLPVDLTPYRQDCHKGPKVVAIRAILSWNVAMPCGNPAAVPVWGNREETLINIAPSAQAPAGKIAILGGIPVSMIDGTTGLTTPNAKFALNNLAPDALGRPCPFGGRVTVNGYPLVGQSYLAEVSPDGVVWTPLLTGLYPTDQYGNMPALPVKPDPVTHRFDYLPPTQNILSLLAQWDTTGDAPWSVRLTTYAGPKSSTTALATGQDVHVVQLDNTWPAASIDITSGTGNCGKFGIGATISGDFVARDLYLGSYSLSVEPPINAAPVGVPSPAGGLVQTAPAPGDGWTLDTTGMKPCGYVVRLDVVDRTIVNSQSVGHHTPASVGFCLEAKVKG